MVKKAKKEKKAKSAETPVTATEVREHIDRGVAAADNPAHKPAEKPEEKPEPRRFVEKKPVSYSEHIAESRKSLDQPLQPGQQFFESPDGEIIVGESDKTQVWSRRMNGGKGGWVNPRR